jgi:hypothetical protein
MTARRAFVLAVVFSILVAATVQAAPKPSPTPGGANQVSAVSGKLGQNLWNGVLRFKLVEARDATAADHPESIVPGPNEKVMVITAIIKNGTPGTWGDLVSYTLADKDEVSVDLPMHYFKPVSLTIQQGAAARQTALVPVDKNFVPVKLIFTCTTCGPKFKAFRVTIPPAAH